MAKKPKNKDALAELPAAPHKVLSRLILELTKEFPDVRRECFDFLKSQVFVSKALAKRSQGEAVLSLWSELAPDLEDLDEFGGGDYASEDLVAELPGQIGDRLASKKVDADHRREIPDLVLPFIRRTAIYSNNALRQVIRMRRKPICLTVPVSTAFGRVMKSDLKFYRFHPFTGGWCASDRIGGVFDILKACLPWHRRKYD